MEILKEEEELHLSEMTAKIISSRITVVPLILVKECQDTWFQLLQKALMNLVLDMGILGRAQNVSFYEQVQISMTEPEYNIFLANILNQILSKK